MLIITAVLIRVKIFSFHRGEFSHLGTENGYFGMDGAYDKKFFRDIGYCSDSEGRWRHHHPLMHPCVQEKKSLQLLIHPIWFNTSDLLLFNLTARGGGSLWGP